MGLDMFVYATKIEPEKSIDFHNKFYDEIVFYWRKHPNMHGWMVNLYREKGGTKPSFDFTLSLSIEDICKLEQDVLDDKLPFTSGFFFGTSRPEQKEGDLEFIQKAKKSISEGNFLFYEGG